MGYVIKSAIDLIKSDTVMLVFAVGGALCGLVMTEVAPWVGIVALAASLVALDVFVLSVPAWTGRTAIRLAHGPHAPGCRRGRRAGGSGGGERRGLAGGRRGDGVPRGPRSSGCAASRWSRPGDCWPRVRRSTLRLLVGFSVGELPLVLIAASAGVVGAEAGRRCRFRDRVGAGRTRIGRGRDGAAPAGRAAHADDDLLLAAVTEAILDGMPESLPQR